MIRRLIILLLIVVGWGQNEGDVIITEFFFNKSAGNLPEYVELFNKATSTIDLNGWKMYIDGEPDTLEIDVPFNIAPKDYIVILSDGRFQSEDWATYCSSVHYGFPNVCNMPIDNLFWSSSTFSDLPNSSGSIKIWDNSDTPIVIDSVAYSAEANFPVGDDIFGMAAEFIQYPLLNNSHLLNDIGENWQSSQNPSEWLWNGSTHDYGSPLSVGLYSFGCTDPEACNYDETSTADDGSCEYAMENYNCDGNCIVDIDCAGICDGTAVLSGCDNACGSTAVEDCAGVCGGTTVLDECEVCNGSGTEENYDCDGNCIAELDCQGYCGGNNIPTFQCENGEIVCNPADCGDGLDDCDNYTEEICESSQECYWVEGCQLCLGYSLHNKECIEGCDGEWYWLSYSDYHYVNNEIPDLDLNGNCCFYQDLDFCGVCNGDGIADGACDCDGNIVDECGECGGDGIDAGVCDCYGNVEDECGECDGNDWDMCDDDDNGITNKEQYGYGAYGLTVIDIPNDQGGYVYLSFTKSFFDTDTLSSNASYDGVEFYTIERKDEDIWVSLNSIAAYGKELYIAVTITLNDSISTDNALTEFRVIAAMMEGNFASNETANGYSVDNIAPSTPSSFWGEYDINENKAVLSWDSSEANDISYYNIYKNTEFYTIATETNFIDEITTDTEYSVSAVDIHENESGMSEGILVSMPLTIIDNLMPTEYALIAAYPNPFNPITKITYGLPENKDVHISVYNMTGTHITTLVNTFQTAGYYSIDWNASSYTSGVYLIRMDSGDFTQTQKVVLVK